MHLVSNMKLTHINAKTLSESLRVIKPQFPNDRSVNNSKQSNNKRDSRAQARERKRKDKKDKREKREERRREVTKYLRRRSKTIKHD
ncbi:hypothetical protein ANTQUA_LOCUS1103 [Anthophora quadrimaculata]